MAGFLADRTGGSVLLGRELGRGGEGVVSEVVGSPDILAKIYLTPPGPDLAAKLAAMAASGTADLLKLAAWPTDLVLDRGRTVGFLMPRASGFRPAFELYGPKLRLHCFPQADWRFLIRAAANTARAFASVHSARQVIGDVNHGNLLVGPDADVRLIDCDSFQMSSRGRIWFCQVGVATHQPPEMQGMHSYAGFARTPNHDAFGLAVLIFQMLFMARHPFSGRWQGEGEPPPIEEAIRGFRYAFSSDQRATLTAPPPGSLPIEAVGTQVRDMFEKAFLRGGAARGGRPKAKRWIAALDDLAGSLRACAVKPEHHYLATLRACPWCVLEGRGGVRFFPVTFEKGGKDLRGADGFMTLWHQVEALPLPGPHGRMPAPAKVLPSLAAKAMGQKKRSALASLGAFAFMACIAIRLGAPADLVTRMLVIVTSLLVAAGALIHVTFGRGLKTRLACRRNEWRALQAAWASTSGRDKAVAVRKRLDTFKTAYDALCVDRDNMLRAIQQNRHAEQLNDYLRRFRIAGAGIRRIGVGKAAILQSNGIETAADIFEQRIVRIVGFGWRRAVANLIGWRNAHAAQFRFDPAKPGSPTGIAHVENAFVRNSRDLESELSKGLTELRETILAETTAGSALVVRHADLSLAYGQAIADARAVLFYP